MNMFNVVKLVALNPFPQTMGSLTKPECLAFNLFQINNNISNFNFNRACVQIPSTLVFRYSSNDFTGLVVT